MAQVERIIETYDDNGLVEVKTIMVEEQPIVDLISQKEEELIRVYNELEALKNK